jgi:hypothetical protein
MNALFERTLGRYWYLPFERLITENLSRAHVKDISVSVNVNNRIYVMNNALNLL